MLTLQIPTWGGISENEDNADDVASSEENDTEDETPDSSEDGSEEEKQGSLEDDSEANNPSEKEGTEAKSPSEEDEAEEGSREEDPTESEGKTPTAENTEQEAEKSAEAHEANAETAETAVQTETGSFIMPEYQAENVIEVETLVNDPVSETDNSEGAADNPETSETVYETVTIENITWQSEPEYDGDTEGEYIFTAVLPEGYILTEKVNTPQIIVTVDEDALKEDALTDGGTIPLSMRPYDEETSSDMVYYLEETYESYSWEVSTGSGLWTELEYHEPEIVVSKEKWYANAYRCIVVQDGIRYAAVSEEPLGAGNGGIMLMAANTIPTESSDYMNYGPGSGTYLFNIHGIDNGTQIWTTFLDHGYYVASSVGGASKVKWSNRTGNAMGNSLYGSMELSLVYGGRYVKIEYKVENRGSATQSFQVGSSADVMIGNNDFAPVVGTGSGLTMSGAPKNNYRFNLSAPSVNTLWYGHYSQAYDNMFIDLADKATPYDKDSGMAWSWSGSVESGKTWSRYVLVGVGELPEPTSPPVFDDKNTNLVPGIEEHLTGTATPGDTVYVVIGGEEYSATVDDNGRFDITVTLPEDMPLGETQMDAWAVSPEGGISDTVTDTATIVTGPYITLTDTSVDVIEEDSLTDEWYRSFIKNSYGTVTYTTINTGTPGSYTVTYTASAPNFPDGKESLTVNVLPKPLEFSAITATRVTGQASFTLSATLRYPGGETITETGFVWGVMQNPTVDINNGKAATSSVVKTKNGTLQVTAADIVDGVNYYARAYAKTASGYYYSTQQGFDIAGKKYGTFSIKNNGNNTFTITRNDGSDDAQTVYYRTVNGSAIGGTHFAHTTSSSSVTFAQGETSKTVTITEYGVTAAYNSNTATSYSNADRTYQVEIYRVDGGGRIDENNRFATRTMSVSSSYNISRTVYDATSTTSASSSNTSSDRMVRDDYTNTRSGNPQINYYYAQDGNNYNYNYYNSTSLSSIFSTNTANYLKGTAQDWLYRCNFSVYEDVDGYLNTVIRASNQNLPNALFEKSATSGAPGLRTTNPNSAAGGSSTTVYSDNELLDYGLLWSACIDPSSSKTLYDNIQFPGNSQDYSFSGTSKFSTFNINTVENLVYLNSKYWCVIDPGLSAYTNFGANGESDDIFYIPSFTAYAWVRDTQEPQLLGVAPMAGGAYKIGDTVTIALVFDEIVDKTNSTLGSVTVTTNWGTFSYTGGADTNVLYFTGTITSSASGSLALQSINNPGYIKDMCSTAGTATKTGTGSATGATLDTAKPSVSIENATRSGATATATVKGTNCDILQYTWTQSSAMPVTGWLTCSSASSATVNTRQTSGTWYLHVLGTHSNTGETAYNSRSFNFNDSSGGTAELPDITLSVDNSAWAQSRDISVTRKPSNAAVTVKTPTGATATVNGSAYTATANGTYTFTLTSNGETVVKTATVSRIDATDPTAVIAGPANPAQTENVILTITPSDAGGSGVRSVTGQWVNGGSTTSASLTQNSDGTYSATTPAEDDTKSTWQLKVTVTDNAGNSAVINSLTYTVNLKKPTVTVTETASTNKGNTYSYTVNANENTIAMIQLPDGSTTTDLTGSFTLTSPGTYYVVVSDEAGHVVYSEAITVAGGVDGTAPDVRLYQQNINWTNQPETIDVSVYEEGSISTAVWKKEGGSDTDLTLATTEPSVYDGSFKADRNGTYTVTVTDANGNIGTAEITVSNIDDIPPEATAEIISTPDGSNSWFKTAPNVIVTYEDGESGIAGVQYAFVAEKTDTAPADSALTDMQEVETGIGTVSPEEDGIYYLYYKVTDNAGNITDGYSDLMKVETSVPALTVDGQDEGQDEATGLTFSVSAATFGASGGYVVAAKSGTAEADAEKFIEVSEAEAGNGKASTKTGTYRVTESGIYYFKMYTNAGNSTEVTRDVYKVIFDSKGGSEVPAQLVWTSRSDTLADTVECKVVRPDDPTFKGHFFDDWYTDEACKNQFDFDTQTQVKTDTTLYANWTTGSFKVEYRMKDNGQYIDFETEEEYQGYTYGEGLANLPVPPEREGGYRFSGWYLTEDCTGEMQTAISETDVGDRVFYGRWVDVEDPNLTAELSRGETTDGTDNSTWYIATPEIELRYSDNDGVTRLSVKTDGGSYQTINEKGDSAFDDSAYTYTDISEGIHTYTFMVEDEEGNHAEASVTVNMDTKAPVIEDVSHNGTVFKDRIMGDSLHISVFITEKGSGIKDGILNYTLIAKTGAEIGRTAAVSKSAADADYDYLAEIVVDAEFEGTIRMTAADNAGHDSDVKEMELLVENTKPEIAVTLSTEGAKFTDWLPDAETVKVSVDDEAKNRLTSGIAEVTYSIDGQTAVEISGKGFADEIVSSCDFTVDISGRGEHTLSITAADHAGNTSMEKRVIRISEREETPDASLDKDNGRIKGLIPGAEYDITYEDENGKEHTDTRKADENGNLDIENDWTGGPVDIVKKGNGEDASDSPEKRVDIPEREPAPSDAKMKKKAGSNGKDGVIGGLQPGETYQISTDGGETWEDVTADENGEIKPVDAGSYDIRKKAGDNTLPSDPVHVDVTKQKGESGNGGGSSTGGDNGDGTTGGDNGGDSGNSDDTAGGDNSGGTTGGGDKGGQKPDGNSGGDSSADDDPADGTTSDKGGGFGGTTGSQPEETTDSQPGEPGQPNDTDRPTGSGQSEETGKDRQPTVGTGTLPDGRVIPAELDENGNIVARGGDILSGSNGEDAGETDGDGSIAVITGTISGAESDITILTVGEGAVIVTVVSDEYQCDAGVADTVAVTNAILTSEQKRLANNGETIEIRVDVKDISEQVSQEDKDIIEKGLAADGEAGRVAEDGLGGLTLGAYIDISMYIRMGDSDWNAVTQADEPIEVIIGIPDGLQDDDRIFYIARAHEGTYTLLDDLDSEPDTITIKTELFSTYAIVFRQPDVTGSRCSLCHICPTFLGICCFIWLAVIMVIIAAAVILIFGTRRRKEERAS